MADFLIIDDNGVIHSGSEEEMNIAFNAMCGNEDCFNTKKEYKAAVKEYKTEWSGDLRLVEVKAVAR